MHFLRKSRDILHFLLQQDSLISDSELSQYFAHDVQGPLSDFVVAGSEDEDHPGSSCSASEDGSLPPGSSSKQDRPRGPWALHSKNQMLVCTSPLEAMVV